jgi:hypothetical protein
MFRIEKIERGASDWQRTLSDTTGKWFWTLGRERDFSHRPSPLVAVT